MPVIKNGTKDINSASKRMVEMPATTVPPHQTEKKIIINSNAKAEPDFVVGKEFSIATARVEGFTFVSITEDGSVESSEPQYAHTSPLFFVEAPQFGHLIYLTIIFL